MRQLAALAAALLAFACDTPEPPAGQPPARLAELALPADGAALDQWREGEEKALTNRFAAMVNGRWARLTVPDAAQDLKGQGFDCAPQRDGGQACRRAVWDRNCNHVWSVLLVPADPPKPAFGSAKAAFKRECAAPGAAEAPASPLTGPAGLALGDWRGGDPDAVADAFAEAVDARYADATVAAIRADLAANGFTCAEVGVGLLECRFDLLERDCEHLWTVEVGSVGAGANGEAKGGFQVMCLGARPEP